MLISEISKRTGFSKDTLRWYEKIGLIQLDKKARSENNYRQYDEQTLTRLLNIRELKSFGFTLKEIAELLLLEEIEDLNCGTVGPILAPKIEKLEQKIREMQRLHKRLVQVKDTCTGDCKAAMTAATD